MTEHDIDLVHRALDGEATPEDRAQLELLLDHSPEAARFYENQQRLFDMLETVRLERPPEHLSRRVLASIDDRPVLRAVEGRRNVLATLATDTRARAGLAIAATVAVALLGIGLLTDGFDRIKPASNGSVSGSMLPVASLPSETRFDESGVSGRLGVVVSPMGTLVDLEVSSVEPVSVVVWGDGGRVASFEGDVADPRLDGSRFRADLSGDQGPCRIVFRGESPTRVRLTVARAGELLLEAEVAPHRP